MRIHFILIAIFYGVIELAGQATYPKAIKAEIKQVENNLAGRIKIDGKGYNIRDRMAHYKVKGLSMAVVRNYKVIWAKGYGWADEKEKRPVTTETLFKPGSISKSLNALGALKLVQGNQLELHKDINSYLKSWQFPYDSLSKGGKITLAHLLSHTAGISVYGGFPGYNKDSKIPSIPDILDGKEPANTPPVRSLFEPGLQFQYSGGGTIISQLMITDVSHQGYEKFMYGSVLKPLGMTQSFYSAAPPAGDQLKKIATGYTKEGVEVDATFRVYPEQAPLGLWTTPTDLCHYLIEAQLAYQGKSAKVLHQEMARLHLTPYIDANATLGAFVQERNGVKYFFHDAGNEGYRGLYFASIEDGDGVVILVNSDEGEIILEVLNSVASVYNWKGFDKPASVYTKEISKTLEEKYVGVYLYEGKIAAVTRKQDGLYFWTAGQEVKMYFTSDQDFINIEFPAEKSFLTDTAGNVLGYSRKLNGVEYPPAMKVAKVDTILANAGELNYFGWHLLETKRLDEAIQYLSRGIETEPNDVNIKVNLAHCYLFKNEYAHAIKLYKAYLAQKPDDESSLKSTIKQDFDFFLKNGFDKALIQKASTELML